ncbi:helix-turn-helix domain-containing protein [Paenibacillus sp. WLX2291]|uniref:helix-turn-helix domain-containing protein n=1 Tax=Paenibacillus sp. WLX2291 TaxID=3296934 RepID=UPI0039840063
MPFIQQHTLLPTDTAGQRIRAARLENHMTIREVASRIQISTNSLSSIENEKTNPSLLIVGKLSTLYNKEIWYLGAYEHMPVETQGQRIRKARYYRGWVKQNLANFFNIEAKSVYNWEADRVRLSSETKKKLDSFFQIFH